MASDGLSSDYFGYRVAIDGETAVVGADQADNGNGAMSGTAYVYTHSGSSWVETELPADAAAGEKYGLSVAIDGDTLAIGATVGNAVYVYRYNGSVWSLEQKLSVASGGLGSSIAIDGDTLVAGAYLDNNNRGAAYIYTRSGTTWTQRKKLTAPVASINNNVYFGYSVDIEGGTVVVGAYKYTYSGMTYSGAAWIWTGSGSSWSLQADMASLAGAELTANDCFGFSVDLNNETLLVGAYNDGLGSAYVFVRNGSTWSKQGNKLTALNAADGGMFFGSSVSLLGDRAFIGADYDHVDNGREGSVHEFIRDSGVWTEQEQLIYASDRESLDWFGCSVAFSDQYLLVGAYKEDEKASDAGAAYIYDLRTFTDLALFAQSWLSNDAEFDIAPDGGDGIVNLLDFSVLAEQWQ
jgi:hypothetical protein